MFSSVVPASVVVVFVYLAVYLLWVVVPLL